MLLILAKDLSWQYSNDRGLLYRPRAQVNLATTTECNIETKILIKPYLHANATFLFQPAVPGSSKILDGGLQNIWLDQ